MALGLNSISRITFAGTPAAIVPGGTSCGDHRVGADHRPVADLDPAGDHAVDAEPDVVADPHRPPRDEALPGDRARRGRHSDGRRRRRSSRWRTSRGRRSRSARPPRASCSCSKSSPGRSGSRPRGRGSASSRARAGSSRRSSAGPSRAPRAPRPRPGSGCRRRRGRVAVDPPAAERRRLRSYQRRLTSQVRQAASSLIARSLADRVTAPAHGQDAHGPSRTAPHGLGARRQRDLAISGAHRAGRGRSSAPNAASAPARVEAGRARRLDGAVGADAGADHGRGRSARGSPAGARADGRGPVGGAIADDGPEPARLPGAPASTPRSSTCARRCPRATTTRPDPGARGPGAVSESAAWQGISERSRSRRHAGRMRTAARA